MLTTLTRKLCPLMTLVVTMISCGKKIEEPKSRTATQRQNQELPAAYVIRLDGSQNSMKNYHMPKPAQFEIPERLKVRKGNTAGKIVEIAYDVSQYDSDDFQFKCTYTPSANLAELLLSSCQDFDGNDFGDVTGHEFTLYLNDMIQVRFKGAPSTDMVVEAIYTMEWI